MPALASELMASCEESQCGVKGTVHLLRARKECLHSVIAQARGRGLCAATAVINTRKTSLSPASLFLCHLDGLISLKSAATRANAHASAR